MKWTDFEDIAEALFNLYPETDPVKLRFTQLHAMIVALEGFEDDPQASNEAKLEKILLAWLDLRD